MIYDCGGQKLCYQFVFGPQLIYMWDMSQSYILGPEPHLVCLPPTLNAI